MVFSDGKVDGPVLACSKVCFPVEGGTCSKFFSLYLGISTWMNNQHTGIGVNSQPSMELVPRNPSLGSTAK